MRRKGQGAGRAIPGLFQYAEEPLNTLNDLRPPGNIAEAQTQVRGRRLGGEIGAAGETATPARRASAVTATSSVPSGSRSHR